MNSDTSTPSHTNWPVNILATMVFLIPAVGVPNEYMLQDTLKSAIASFGILLAACAWVWDLQKHPRPLRWHWILFLPIALCLYALGSMVWSHAYLAGVEAVRWFLISLATLLTMNVMKDQQSISRLMWTMHWGAFVAAIWVMGQFCSGESLFPQGAPPASTFFNRNFVSEYLVATLPVSALLAWKRRIRWPYSLSSLLPAPTILALLMTGTRSALLAVFVYCVIGGFLFFHAIARQHYKLDFHGVRFTLFLAVVVAVMGLLPSAPNLDGGTQSISAWNRFIGRAQSVTHQAEFSTGSFYTRTELWKTSIRMIQNHPWTGIGAGAWEVQTPLYQRADTSLETDYYAHSELLQLLSEYGLAVGGVTLSLFLAACVQRALLLRQSEDGSNGNQWAGAQLVALTGLITVSLFGFPFHLAGGCVLLGVFLGAIFGPLGRTFSYPAHRITGILIGLWLSICLIGATYATVQAVRAEFALLRALENTQLLARVPKQDAARITELVIRIRQDAIAGIEINPHYRKLTPMISEVLMAQSQWNDAAWILDSVIGSRPNVPALLEGLALASAQLGDSQRADTAVQQLRRVRPESPSTFNTEIVVLANTGRDHIARKTAWSYLQAGNVSYQLLNSMYALGLKTQDWSLAIEALKLRNEKWPEQATDGFFRLGQIYTNATLNDRSAAVQAFRTGMLSLPISLQEKYLEQVPSELRTDVKKGT